MPAPRIPRLRDWSSEMSDLRDTFGKILLFLIVLCLVGGFVARAQGQFALTFAAFVLCPILGVVLGIVAWR